MKKKFITFCFLLTTFFAFSQRDVVTLKERYNAAVSWAQKNNPDSAFAQLTLLAKTAGDEIIEYKKLGKDKNFSSLHSDKRWQPFIKSIYSQMATVFTSRIRSRNWTNPTLDGYAAAWFWAVAGEPDSAFLYLENIAYTSVNKFTRYADVSTDSTFSYLYNDKRWQPIMDTIKKNYSPRRGSHPKGDAISQIPMSFTIDPKSSFLKSDRNESYKNGVDKILSVQMHAYNFLGSGKNHLESSYNKTNLSSRFIVLDLSQPIANSGSVSQGVIKDHDAQFHTFNIIDKTVTPWVIYDFRDIPVGTTIESPRTQIDIHINGVVHMFQIGSWTLSDGNEWYAYGGKLNGNGTTKVNITRNNESSYQIVAPEGSIGRLWNISNLSKPIDMGLFKTGFIIHLHQE